MATQAAPLIAVMDPEPVFCTLMTELLTEVGYQVRTWTTPADIYTVVQAMQPALLIVDLPLDEPDALWTLLSLLRLNPATRALPILVYSVATTLLRNSTPRLQSLGCAVLEKPFDLDELLGLIQRYVPTPVG